MIYVSLSGKSIRQLVSEYRLELSFQIKMVFIIGIPPNEFIGNACAVYISYLMYIEILLNGFDFEKKTSEFPYSQILHFDMFWKIIRWRQSKDPSFQFTCVITICHGMLSLTLYPKSAFIQSARYT